MKLHQIDIDRIKVEKQAMRRNTGVTTKGKNLGVDNLKKGILWLVTSYSKGQEVLADDKVTFWEAIGLVPTISEGVALASNYKAIVEEVIDLTVEEAQDVIEYINQQLPELETSSIDLFLWAMRTISAMYQQARDFERILKGEVLQQS